jgi:hypothetical protein
MKNELRKTCRVVLKYIFIAFVLLNSITTKIYAGISINEIFVTNASADIETPSYNYINWIELYNSDANAQYLNTYYLSDNPANLKMWKFPSGYSISPKGFFTVFADGTNALKHTNFKPDADGGTLYLSNSAGVIVSQVKYPPQYTNNSFGSYPDGSQNYFYFVNSTRNKKNDSTGLKLASGKVVSNISGGFYKTSISVQLSSSSLQGKIYYTLDGNDPDTTSFEYNQSLTFNTTTVLKARVFENGKLPGKITTHTYFVKLNRPDIKLPVVSLVFPSKFFYDDMIGIYVVGKNGIEDNCYGKSNWNQDWERSTNFEFFDINKTCQINQLTGMQISGACSRTKDQKSLSIYARKKYGDTSLKYKFFDKKNISNFESIYLRNSGNDWCKTMIRDNMMQSLLVGRMDLDYLADNPAVLFVNGAYFGIQNIHEKGNESYILSNHGVEETNLDYLEGNNMSIVGTAAGYNSMISYMNTHSLSNNQYYQEIAKQMDVDNYMNYMIFQYFVNNSDWPGNNIKFWRQKSPETKWRWVVYDTDFGFGLVYDYTFNMLTFGFNPSGPGWPNPDWSTFLARKLIENPDFKSKFIHRFYAHLNTTFTPTRVNRIIDSIKNIISSEVTYHYPLYNRSVSDWTYNTNILKEFANKRPENMRKHLREYFGLGEDVGIEYHSNITKAGNIVMDGIEAEDTVTKGFVPKGMVCEIQFKAKPGYVFEKAIRKSGIPQNITLISSGEAWKYFDKGSLPSNNWNSSSTDDSGWSSGISELGYGDGDEGTVVGFGSDPNYKYITTYFRKFFNYNTSIPTDSIVLRLNYDDGIVVYLNGTELKRINMPAGTIQYSTLANGSPAVENTFSDFIIDKQLLINGQNIIAAEVHQNSVTSSDVSFNLEMMQYVSPEGTNATITKSKVTETINSSTIYFAYYKKAEPLNSVAINEVLTNNIKYKDEYGEYDSWVELMNNSSDTIDISGLILSKDDKKLTKWSIPSSASTILAPNSYLAFWADGMPKQGLNHMNFALDNTFTNLSLWQVIGSDTIVIDRFDYAKTTGTRSNGRIPNGNGYVKALTTTTLASLNIDNITELEEIEKQESSIFYNDRSLDLTIRNFTDNTLNLIVTDISGRVIINYNGKIIDTKHFSLAKEVSGVYIVRLLSSNRMESKKIIVR